MSVPTWPSARRQLLRHTPCQYWMGRRQLPRHTLCQYWAGRRHIASCAMPVLDRAYHTLCQ
eukprot:3941578-Rhodomonas_salina.2